MPRTSETLHPERVSTTRFVSGHGFSRAAPALDKCRALAPEDGHPASKSPVCWDIGRVPSLNALGFICSLLLVILRGGVVALLGGDGEVRSRYADFDLAVFAVVDRFVA